MYYKENCNECYENTSLIHSLLVEKPSYEMIELLRNLSNPILSRSIQLSKQTKILT
jgi:hypothetical protein